MEKREGLVKKRAQVTIFVILGILMVITIIVLFIFQNKVSILTTREVNPTNFITDCVKKDLIVAVDNIIYKGGVYSSGLNKDQFFDLNGSNLAILCWANSSKTSCTNTHPLLVDEARLTLERIITPKINSCFNKLKNSYPNLEVSSENPEFIISLERGFVSVKLRKQVVLSAEEGSELVNNFDFDFSSELYEFLDLANVVVTAESSCVCTPHISEEILYTDVSLFSTNPFLTSGPNSRCDADLSALARAYTGYIFERNNLPTGEKVYTISSQPTVQNFSFVVKNCYSVGCEGPGGICFHHYHVGSVVHYASTENKCHNDIHHYHDASLEFVID